MPSMTKKLVGLVLLLSSSSLFTVTPYYSIRSQAENAARELAGAGWATQINHCDEDLLYGTFSLTPAYTKSFQPNNIGKSLFGCCGNCYYPCGTCGGTINNSCGNLVCATGGCDDDYTAIRISGSQAHNRGACDWLADYFGLPTDYKSCVKFKPSINNFIVDFNLFAGIDCCKGLYFRVKLPVVYTRWDLNMCECIETKGTNHHWAGYFNNALTVSGTGTYGILRDNLVTDFTTFINGCGTIGDSEITLDRLCYARMCRSSMSRGRLAEISAAIGWNFWCDEDYHLGFNARAAAPAGNRPQAYYLFEPIVGNGKHWEAGGGFSAHWTFWRGKTEDRYCSFYIDANVTHLFKTKQCRTFDLKCKPLSRYMLAAKFGRPVDNLDTAVATPIKQFKDIYSPVANLTTFPVDVSVDAQGDVAVKFQYVHGNWGCDLGYNFWARTCENIDFTCGCGCPFEENTWVLKGDAFMYGFLIIENTPCLPTALSASQSGATLCNGSNNYPNGIIDSADGITVINWYRNPGVDLRQLAIYGPLVASLYTFPPTNIALAGTVYTSVQPVFISICDIDCDSARTRAMSHKIFGSIDHTWRDSEIAIPFLGVGFELEFGHHTFDNGCDLCCYPGNLTSESCGNCYHPCDRCCNDMCCCQYCSLSQWGVWLKGGLAF